MPLRRALIPLLVTLTAATAAGAGGTSGATFLASLTGTVTKRWTYATSQSVNGCSVKTTGAGNRTISLRSSDDSVVVARRAAGGRARFSGSVRFLHEYVQQAGTKTTQSTGPGACDSSPRRLVCKRIARSLQNRAAQPVSRRLHRLTFQPMRALVPDAFLSSRCPGEPSAVRDVAGGVELAVARFSEADVFDRTAGGITLQGTTDVTTQTLSGSAKVVQHVSWRLRLRRLGG